MDENQHRALAEVLHNIQGMALISGYPSGLYDELYSGWEVRQCHSRTNTIRNGGKVAVECLWISPNAARASLQKSLF
jgi:DNA adenine methylase